ncbi:MAG: hypothetical protein K2Q28_12025 [Hyphomicrobium sp.]|nr:hypothetical protein [Hyphomicrobium sp.]
MIRTLASEIRHSVAVLIGGPVLCGDYCWAFANAKIIYLLLVAGALALVIALLSIYHLRWKSHWLSGQIDAEIKANTRTNATESIPTRYKILKYRSSARLRCHRAVEKCVDWIQTERRKRFEEPSLKSLAIVLLLIALFFAPLKSRMGDGYDPFTIANWYKEIADTNLDSSVAAGFTGLAVIIVALLIFVAETIRGGYEVEQKRLLLKISMIWPLGVAITLIPLGFILAKPGLPSVLLAAILALTTLFAFSGVIRNLLDPALMESNRKKQLRERLYNTILLSARRRVGDALLLNYMKSGGPLQQLRYVPSASWISKINNYKILEHPDEGWLQDIHIEELKKVLDRLDLYAQSQFGFSLSGKKANLKAKADDALETKEAITEDHEPRPIYLLKRLEEDVPSSSLFRARQRALLAVPAQLLERDEMNAELTGAIPFVFKLSNNHKASDLFTQELQASKDGFIAALRAESPGAVDTFSKLFIEIAEIFLEALVNMGATYKPDMARKERNGWGGGWVEIDSLRDDWREILPVAVKTENRSIATSVSYLPFAIASRAFQVRDHYCFQEFIVLADYLYWVAEREKGTVEELLKERSWRYVHEIAKFQIEPALQNNETGADEINDFLEFLLFAVRSLMLVAKQASATRDLKIVREIVDALGDISRSLESEAYRADSEMLKLQISRATEPQELGNQKNALSRQVAYEAASDDLRRGVTQVLLALIGHAIAELLKNGIQEGDLEILAALSNGLPNQMDDLSAAWRDIRGSDPDDYWGWTMWDVIPDGKVRSISSHAQLARGYIFKSLSILSSLREQPALDVRISHSRTLSSVSTGIIAEILNEIETERSADWSRILTEAQRHEVPTLRDLLETARRADQRAELERTRAAPLCQEKVSRFGEELIERYRSTIRLRPLLEWKSAIVDVGRLEGVRTLGYNQVDDKSAFISQEHTSFGGWGEAYGEGLGLAEDRSIFGALLNRAGRKIEVSAEKLNEELTKILQEKIAGDLIIIHTLDYTTEHHFFRSHSGYRSRSASRTASSIASVRGLKGFSGAIEVSGAEIPIFALTSLDEKHDNRMLVVDIKATAKLRQAYAGEPSTGVANILGHIYVCVSDLNEDEESRRKIMQENPSWLAAHESPDEYLRGRALVVVRERFDLDVFNSQGATSLAIGP